jgi:hypothetical protein
MFCILRRHKYISLRQDKVFIAAQGWRGYCSGFSEAWLTVLVRTTKTAKILRIRFRPGEDVVAILEKAVDKRLDIAHLVR